MLKKHIDLLLPYMSTDSSRLYVAPKTNTVVLSSNSGRVTGVAVTSSSEVKNNPLFFPLKTQQAQRLSRCLEDRGESLNPTKILFGSGSLDISNDHNWSSTFAMESGEDVHGKTHAALDTLEIPLGSPVVRFFKNTEEISKALLLASSISAASSFTPIPKVELRGVLTPEKVFVRGWGFSDEFKYLSQGEEILGGVFLTADMVNTLSRSQRTHPHVLVYDKCLTMQYEDTETISTLRIATCDATGAPPYNFVPVINESLHIGKVTAETLLGVVEEAVMVDPAAMLRFRSLSELTVDAVGTGDRFTRIITLAAPSTDSGVALAKELSDKPMAVSIRRLLPFLRWAARREETISFYVEPKEHKFIQFYTPGGVFTSGVTPYK